MSGGSSVSRWTARPVQAALVRAFVLLAPIAGSVAFVHFASGWVEQPTGSLWLFLAWWFGLSLAATAVLFVIDRLARRLLPLAALLKLSLIFPDETPSRLKTALRSGGVDSLERRLELLESVRKARTPREAAERLLELVAALDTHDRLTRGHSERVRAYSVLIGRELRLGSRELDLLNWAALLHDIGKLEVPQQILTKPSRPSDDEWQVLREHPLRGEELVSPLASWLGGWGSAVGDHHERWDGTGYPRGLASDEISLAGRIVAVADVFDVITSTRSYKQASNTVEARKEIARCAGSQFDPKVVRAFLNVSLGRMRPILGPLSWLTHAPLLARLPLTPSVGTLGGAFGVVATSAATGLVPHPVAPAVAATPKPPAVTRAAVASTPASEPEVEIPARPTRIAFDTPAPIPRLKLLSGGLVVSLVPATAEPRATNDSAQPIATLSQPAPTLAPSTAPREEQGQLQVDERGTTPDEVAGETTPPAPERSNAPAMPPPPLTLVPAPTKSPVASTKPVDRAVDASALRLPNQPPSFKAGPDQVVLEDAGRQTVRSFVTAVDPGGPGESGQRVTFVVTVSSKSALFSTEPAVASNGTLTYEPAPNANGAATVSIRAVDDGGTANGGEDTSPPQSFTITVQPVNDAPSFTAGADQTVLEDSTPKPLTWTAGVSAGPSDESAQTVSFSVTTDGADLFAVQPKISADGTLSYRPAPNKSGVAKLTVTAVDDAGTANGGVDTSPPETFAVTVVPVNDAPSFAAGPDQTAKGAGLQTIAGWATGISPGPGDESTQTVSFAVENENQALFAVQPAVAGDGTLTYTPKSGTSGTATVAVRAHDSGGTANGGVDTSPPQTFTITVLARNEAPSFELGPDQSTLSVLGKQTIPGWAKEISAGDPGESGQTVTFVVSNDSPGLFAAQPAVAPNGTLTYTPGLLAIGVATVTVQARDDGGTANGGVDTSPPQTFTITIL